MEAGMVDSSENSVIVCMDYIKGRCSRDKCKYFHPPAHLQARIKAAQHQASQNTASAALVSPSYNCDGNQHWIIISIIQEDELQFFVCDTINSDWKDTNVSEQSSCKVTIQSSACLLHPAVKQEKDPWFYS